MILEGLAINFIKDNLPRIIAGAVIIVTVSVVYFSWRSDICNQCKNKERESWEQQLTEANRIAEQTSKLWAHEKLIKEAKQDEITKGIVQYYADRIEVLNNRIVADAGRRMYINTVKKDGCSGPTVRGESKDVQGAGDQSQKVERAEIDGETAARIRSTINGLAQEEILLDSFIKFVEDNELYE